MVSKSASQPIDLGLIPNQIIPNTLKMVFTASLLDTHNEENIAAKKPAGSFVESLQKAFNGIPPSLHG